MQLQIRCQKKLFKKKANRKQRDYDQKQLTARLSDDHETQRVIEHIRKAKKSNQDASLTVMDWLSIMDHFGNRCALRFSFNITMDHFLPQSIGGPTNRFNVYPLDLLLNSSKNDSNPFIWADHQIREGNISDDLFQELISYFANLHNVTSDEFKRYVFWCFQERIVDFEKWKIADLKMQLTTQALQYNAAQFNLTEMNYLLFSKYCIEHHLLIDAKHIPTWLEINKGELL